MALKSVEIQPSRALTPSNDQTERELLERIARSRDQAAFRTLYGNYYQRLSRLLMPARLIIAMDRRSPKAP